MFAAVVTVSRPGRNDLAVTNWLRVLLCSIATSRCDNAGQGRGEVDDVAAFDAVRADSHGVGLDAEATKLLPEPIVCGVGRAEVIAPLAIGQFAQAVHELAGSNSGAARLREDLANIGQQKLSVDG